MNFHEPLIYHYSIRENSWLAEQGFWGEAPKPLFALTLFGSGFAHLVAK